ncbi:MAG: tetratricopeptide repeat protein [Candidatus Omnitrophica bacterium]|nr:tetratricopeptide repeat protein [Candidatus Omnitrophota bacterium]
MKRIVILLTLIFFSGANLSFALDWAKLHEEADKTDLPKAKAAVQAKPGSAEARYVLGLVYLNEHKDNDAKKAFENILESNPDIFEARWGLAEVLRRQHQLEPSKKIIAEIIKLNSDFSPAYITLAYVLYIQMDFNGSVRTVLKVMNQDKDKVDLSNYVRAYLLYGGAKGAIAHFGGPLSKVINGTAVFSNLKKAEKLQPENAAVKYGLGAFYLLAPGFVGGDLELAEEYLTKSVELDPLFANAYVRLAEVYKAKGDKAKYELYLAKAFEIDPGCELARDVKNNTCKYVCYEGGK